MRRFHPLILAAAALLFISACSSPDDLASPTLEPQFGTVDDEGGVDVATASSGRIYVLSQRTGPHDHLGYPDGYGSYSSVVLQRQDGSGKVIWERQIVWSACDPYPDYYGNDCGAVRAVSLAADAQGYINALSVSTYSGTSEDVDYENVTYRVDKYSASGQVVSSLNLHYEFSDYWTSGVTASSVNAGVTAFTVDASGNIFITHMVHGSGSEYSGSYVVAKHDPNGALLWQRASLVGTPSDITVSSSGSVYVVGTTGVARYTNSGDLTWKRAGNFEEVIVSGSNLYTRYRKEIRKWDGNGKQLWRKVQGGLNTLVLQDMDGDGNGNVYLSGKYEVSGPNWNAMVRKLNPSGASLWTKTYGTPAYDDAKGIATINGSEIYTTGLTRGDLAHANKGGEDGYIRKLNSTGNPLWTR